MKTNNKLAFNLLSRLVISSSLLFLSLEDNSYNLTNWATARTPKTITKRVTNLELIFLSITMNKGTTIKYRGEYFHPRMGDSQQIKEL